MKTAILDNPKEIKKYDKSDMLGLIESFPKHCREAKAIGAGFRPPGKFKAGYENVIATGMGGSAIGADLIRSYVADEIKMPLSVNRNYTLPNFVGGRSLVIASSYSGNTEETISAYNAARRRGAKIIVITSGGRLRAMAENDNNPVIIIPGGLPPRCALGYSSVSFLVLLSKLGLIGPKSSQIDETIELLGRLRDNKLGIAIPERRNTAKKIACRLYGKFPVIYGGYDHTDAVVTRWRGELSENSKTLSSGNLFPEMNHNEIMGWQNPKKLLKGLTAVILRDAGDHARNSRRMDVTGKVLARENIDVLEIRSLGKALLARIFSLVYIGDFASFYLSILNREDPTPIERINYLKKELSKA